MKKLLPIFILFSLFALAQKTDWQTKSTELIATNEICFQESQIKPIQEAIKNENKYFPCEVFIAQFSKNDVLWKKQYAWTTNKTNFPCDDTNYQKEWTNLLDSINTNHQENYQNFLLLRNQQANYEEAKKTAEIIADNLLVQKKYQLQLIDLCGKINSKIKYNTTNPIALQLSTLYWSNINLYTRITWEEKDDKPFWLTDEILQNNIHFLQNNIALLQEPDTYTYQQKLAYRAIIEVEKELLAELVKLKSYREGALYTDDFFFIIKEKKQEFEKKYLSFKP